MTVEFDCTEISKLPKIPPVEEWIKLYWRKKGIVCVCMQEIAQLLLLWTFCSKKYTAVYNDVWRCMMTCADEPNDLIPRLHNQLVQGVACWSFVLCGQAAAHYESSLALKRARQTLARSWESWCWWCCKIFCSCDKLRHLNELSAARVARQC